MKRIGLLALAALALAAVSLGCTVEPDPYDSLRVVVDTDASVPDELDAFTVSVTRGGVDLFQETFDSATMAELPDSLIVINGSPNNDSPEKQLTSVPVVTITVTGLLGPDVRVSRSAEIRFNRGQAQLPLPMCRSCLDIDCDAGQTCKLGQCIDPFISDAGALPAESDEMVDALSECGN